ncbi:GTP-binding protein [Rubrobacter taiwanensis]|uniref:GTP-binding protein n=1 Tax=Rubrobacter taiwanensis TaxID=185139 RepID=A0A4R1BH06_9ACTN|nr:GTP-binding protein [Rubrobacter taiwanensis]TCJ16454.1 GTP-binding protein [Rubrobacter taiwanensis]
MKFRQKTPVTLIGGFLGAGKTTLVNRLISSGERRYGVVVNEFGETSVDSALIEELQDGGVAEIGGGCLCCVGREDLSVALYGLICRENPPEYILIELSGLADPVPAAQQLLTTELRGLVDLDSIVAGADARNLERTMFEAPEGKAQLAYASVVVLNKADQVEEETLRAAEKIIRNLNPLVRVVTASYAAVGPEEVTGLKALDPGWRPRGHRVEHGAGLTTFTLRTPDPLPLERWMSFHRRMIIARPGKVLRAKGIIEFREMDGPFVLQTVRELYTFDEYEGEHDGGAELVIIGRNLDEAEYRAAFERVAARTGPDL